MGEGGAIWLGEDIIHDHTMSLYHLCGAREGGMRHVFIGGGGGGRGCPINVLDAVQRRIASCLIMHFRRALARYGADDFFLCACVMKTARALCWLSTEGYVAG